MRTSDERRKGSRKEGRQTRMKNKNRRRRLEEDDDDEGGGKELGEKFLAEEKTSYLMINVMKK